MTERDYQNNLDFLYGLRGIKLGLENTRLLLNHFDNPQLKTRTIHIAGTNGKGSTSAFIESILRASGYKVGLYTSPHLHDFCERIQINRTPIEKKTLCELITRIKKACEILHITVTFFEFSTVLAFLYFFENDTDLNVIEVGLGGRLDATNLCKAEVVIITSISLDHTEYLGGNLRQIASEKAAIIKGSGTVIANIEEDQLFEVINRQSQVHKASIRRLGFDFKTELISHTPSAQKIKYSAGQIQLDGLELPLIGRHQAANAALAIACSLELKTKSEQITEQAIRKGLKSTCWEGRLEVVATDPTILLDCAHNPDGVRILTIAIREYFVFKRCHVILGIMRDKPFEEMVEIISPLADRIVLVKPQQERSWEPKQLKEKLSKYNKAIEIIEKVDYAVEITKKTSASDDLICVTGSIFTVAEARQHIKNKGVF